MAPDAVEAPNRTRWRRYRWPAGIAGVALVLSAAGLPWWTSRGPEQLPRVAPQSVDRIGALPVNDPYFVLGDLTISEPGKEVRVLSVRPLTSSNVSYEWGSLVRPRFYGKGFRAGPGMLPGEAQPHVAPLDEPVEASETAFVPADATQAPPVSLVLSFRVHSGVGAVNGVSVVYEADGVKKRTYFGRAAIACLQPEACTAGDPAADLGLLRQLDLVVDRRV